MTNFPLTSKYDPQWLFDNAMGPNPLQLAEWLTESIPLHARTKILDLGCGRALTSIFLAGEFGAKVSAADLWIKPEDNAHRIAAAGFADLVSPVFAEAHSLPFAKNEFDAILSIDAYHYFGTDDLYLGYITQFLAPAGTLGIVVPGTREELNGQIPDHLKDFWDWQFCSFHTADWWRRHWQKTGLVEIESADWLEGAPQLWLDWSQQCARHAPTAWQPIAAREAEMLRADAGRTLGFVRVIAKKPIAKKRDSSGISFRQADARDIPAMFHVRSSVKQNLLTVPQMALMGITPDSVAAALAKNARAWVAEENGTIIAFSIADRASASIFALFVLPDYEGRGLGSRLLELAITWLTENGVKRIWLTTAPNTRAAAFYRRHGWTCARIQKNGELRLEKQF